MHNGLTQSCFIVVFGIWKNKEIIKQHDLQLNEALLLEQRYTQYTKPKNKHTSAKKKTSIRRI
jgi:hypothetical protein